MKRTHTRQLAKILLVVFVVSSLASELIYAQAPQPTPTAVPTTNPPFWQLTQDQIPWVVLLVVAVVGAIVGGLLRPVIGYLGNQVLVWVQSWGKAGQFRRLYFTAVIGQCRHLPLLPSNVVAAHWRYRHKSIALEELYTPLSLGEQRQDRELDRFDAPGRKPRPRNWWQSLWWRIRPPQEPSAGEVGRTIEQNNPRRAR